MQQWTAWPAVYRSSLFRLLQQLLKLQLTEYRQASAAQSSRAYTVTVLVPAIKVAAVDRTAATGWTIGFQ